MGLGGAALGLLLGALVREGYYWLFAQDHLNGGLVTVLTATVSTLGVVVAVLAALNMLDWTKGHASWFAIGLLPLFVTSILLTPTAFPAQRPDGCPNSGDVPLKDRESTDCWGLIGLDGDPPDQVFGTSDPNDQDSAAHWQQLILKKNEDTPAPEITLIWIGELTCQKYDPYHACAATDPADPQSHDHSAETDELKALYMAQFETPTRVVIANAGEFVARIDDLSQLIVAHDQAGDFGDRRVVIGGGNSKQETFKAITQELLPARMPVIAPTLTADNVGSPFITKPGYLQLAPPNDVYASYVIDGLRKTFPKGVILAIYHKSDNGDLYTSSLTTDLVNRASDAGIQVDQIGPGGLSKLGSALCNGTKNAAGQPTVVFFADRYGRFGQFVKEVGTTCENDLPTLVMADGSANRYLGADHPERTERWGIFYFAAGQQCYNLAKENDGSVAQALLLRLGLAVGNGGLDIHCTAEGGLGDHVAPFWDAARLARRIVHGKQDGLDSMAVSGYALAEGTATVWNGQILVAQPASGAGYPVRLIPPCRRLANGSKRSARYCHPPESRTGVPEPQQFPVPGRDQFFDTPQA